jgi:transcriptional regulator with XRE-family HTH domain
VTEPSQDVRRQVKAARSALDLTQMDLARKARVSRGSVQNLENGITLDVTTESKIEKALGKPVGWLDQIRGRGGARTTTPPPAEVDPSRATLSDLQREYTHFMGLLDAAEMQRLFRLLEIYHRLQLQETAGQNGERSHAEGEN